MSELSEHDTLLLTIEQEWWRYGGTKADVVRERLGLSMRDYYARLNVLIDQAAAGAERPQLVRRLRRQREVRLRLRSAGGRGLREQRGRRG